MNHHARTCIFAIFALTMLAPAVATASMEEQDSQRRGAVNGLDGDSRWSEREVRFERALRAAHDASVMVFAPDGTRASGVNISPSGQVLTALHNLESARVGNVRVQFRDGRVYEGKIEQITREDNLATIALVGKGCGSLPAARIASAEPRRGELLAAIGSPRGSGAPYWVSLGKVRGYAGNQVAYDAWTYWGHGGAPIVNEAGEVVAIHTSWDADTKLRMGTRLARVRALVEGERAAPAPSPRVTAAPLFIRPEHDAQLRAAIDELERDIVWTEHEAEVLEAIRGVHGAAVKIGGGTGVNVSPQGLVVTAFHVVDTSLKKPIAVRFSSGETASGKVIAYDRERDLALLALSAPRDVAYPFARIARDEPGVGEDVVIVGHPGAKSGRKAWHTSVGTILWYGDMVGIRGDLAYDAWTYWGHSGSPVFNTSGEVVGIHNSWNDRNGWRHGLRLATVRAFLVEAGAL